MKSIKRYPHGTFSWIELATPDAKKVKNYYCSIFGWEAQEILPTEGQMMGYTNFTLDGRKVAGMFEMPDEIKNQGMPSAWTNYVAVDDVVEVAGRVESLGGKFIFPATQASDSGWMSIVQDPEGAVFGLWQAGKHFGAEWANDNGYLCWNELNVRKISNVKKFYEELLGWQLDTGPAPDGEGEYTAILNNGRMNGGALEIQESWGDVPPHWIIYISVPDCDASAAKSKELGGTVPVEPFDIPNVGRMAVLQDPNGAVFSIITGTQVDSIPEEWM